MVTKGDAPGSAFQAFPLCTGGVEPTAGGCVRVETLDALGQPTGGTPARVRFSNVVGHFSTWAVAIVTPANSGGGGGGGGTMDPWMLTLLGGAGAWVRRRRQAA